ncbi:acyl-CoA dehydrogenase family protein [Actinomadura soli]|uniref:acyl-CoA dehydrogenase family protein n=1 Tax=Actinomadura soli TaxID=2508997 RepID=UPI001E64C137|nr:acyl-CoA dehydrogenase family protein [Actinomadura soli]
MSHQVLDAVHELLPSLRERAQETEDARVVPEASIKALRESGFFRLLQPANYGGYECDPVTFYTAVRSVASACGSTGWVASVLGAHQWHLATFPAQAQEDTWGQDPSTLVSSAYAPVGRASIVEGGYRLSASGASPRASTMRAPPSSAG